MGKRVDRESPIHRSCVDYLRRVLPSRALIHHSPNEGVRGGVAGKRDGARRKAMGQTPGWPDIEILLDAIFYALEVKAEGGRMSEAQRAVRASLEAQGVHYAVVRSIDDVKETLDEWGVEHRGTIG